MDKRIDSTEPSIGRHPTEGTGSRLNDAAAAFRALLGLTRPQSAPSTDTKTRHKSGSAGSAIRGRGGSHADVATDEAVDASSYDHGEGGRDKDPQHRDSDEGGGMRAGAASMSSSFLTAMAARDALRRDPAARSTSTGSLPPIWPVAPLPGAWRRVDRRASAYVPRATSSAPASANVPRAASSARARTRKPHTQWNPSVAHRIDQMTLPPSWQRAAGEPPLRMLIDTLVSQLRGRSGLALRRGKGERR
jgi:hypothetical protein